MVESYGYYCTICKLRYRYSVCLKEDDKLLCPSGHDLLKHGYWVYRQHTGSYLKIVIAKPISRTEEEVIFREYIYYDENFDKKVKALIQAHKDHPLGEVIDNAINVTSSLHSGQWYIKCQVCKLWKEKNCPHGFKSIYCKDFVRVT